jgi:uncharacterized protein YkwD
MPVAALPADHRPVAVAAVRAERAIVRAVNRTRRRHGLPALRLSGPLARVAAGHSADLASHGMLSHASSDGTPFARRIWRVTRARAIGETIAAAPVGRPPAARTIVRAWLASPSHRRELLSPRFRLVGVGRAQGARSIVVTADFSSAR